MNRTLRIFYSFATRDSGFCDALDKHLALLRRQGHLTTARRSKSTANIKLQNRPDRKLVQADVVVLFISPDYLASDDCVKNEMEYAMERYHRGVMYIMPILIRPVEWKGAQFSELQTLPSNGKPVSTWTNRDEAWLDVTTGIRAALEPARQMAEKRAVEEPSSASLLRTDPGRRLWRYGAIGGLGAVCIVAGLLSQLSVFKGSRQKPPVVVGSSQDGARPAPSPSAGPVPAAPPQPSKSKDQVGPPKIGPRQRPTTGKAGPGKTESENTFERYRSMCEGGDASSCNALGWIYEKGTDLKADQKKSDWFFNRACRLGMDTACDKVK